MPSAPCRPASTGTSAHSASRPCPSWDRAVARPRARASESRSSAAPADRRRRRADSCRQAQRVRYRRRSVGRLRRHGAWSEPGSSLRALGSSVAESKGCSMTGVGPEQVLHVPGHNLEHANLPSYQTSPGPSLFHRGVLRTPREKREANSAPKGLRFVPGTPVASEDVPQVRCARGLGEPAGGGVHSVRLARR